MFPSVPERRDLAASGVPWSISREGVDSEELVCERVWRESYAIVQPQTQEVSVGSLNEFIPPRWRSRGGLVTCAA